MEIENMKKGVCTLKLEKLQKVYNQLGELDPTLLRCTYSIVDFNASGNHQIVSKEVALNAAPTLKFKPLLCQYKETDDYENPDDDFGDHGEFEGKLRNGQDYIFTDTHAIGVAEKEGYLGVIKDKNGNDLDVLLCDFLLWTYRYPNEISLINQFYENNEPLYSSCEYYYKPNDSLDENGNEVIESLIFDGHCVLGKGIEPAYASSMLIAFNTKWNKAINQCLKQNNNIDNNKKTINNKEVTNVMENKFLDYLKSINAISAGDIKWKLYEQLAKVTTGEEYMNLYISNYDIYPTENYFLYEIYTDAYHLYKCSYSVDENDNVTVDYAGKQEVEYKVAIQPISEPDMTDSDAMMEMENSLNAKNKELEELKASLNTANETIKALESEKDGVVEKFNGASETVVSLNSKVEELTSKVSEMQPLIDKYNEEQFKKALNSAKEEYKSKFDKVGATDVFEQEETLELIKKSINSKEDVSKEAKYQLNQLIVDNVKAIKVDEDEDKTPVAKSVNSIVTGKSTKNLDKDFVDPYEEICGFAVEK